jgi:hypothetical protein
MRNKGAYLFLIACILVCANAAKHVNAVSRDDIKSTIQNLYVNVVGSQYQESTSYIPFLQEEKIKGLFPSNVHINFHGDYKLITLRHLFKFADNNNFVTNWILQMMFEAQQLGTIDMSQDTQMLTDALNAISLFKDKNFNDGYAITDFWSQKKSKNGQFWYQSPTNIAETMNYGIDIFDLLERLLKILGWESLLQDIESGLGFMNSLKTAFNIPADFDDSSVNLALGSFLYAQNSPFYSTWQQTFSDVTALSRAYVKYSYQPFVSDNQNDTINNMIDPRTYFWVRGYLDEVAEEAKKNNVQPDVKIVTTWIMNLAEDRGDFFTNETIKMPFNANNVDASVCANSIFGMTMGALTFNDSSKWFDSDLQQVYLDTAKLVAWTVRNNVVLHRPDLALLYYPPTFDFFWFASRTAFLLRHTENIPYDVMNKVRDVLSDAMENEGTKSLLGTVTYDYNNNWAYWDDFLGDNDTSDGKPLNSAEDRLFSTAMAMNALLDTWTQNGGSCQRKWLANTPSDVQNVVNMAASWLNTFILGNKYLPENAFFSGSMKDMSTGPWFYPANRIEDMVGNPIKPTEPQKISGKIVDVVQGYIPDDEYNQLLQQQWFGFPVPLAFDGYNNEQEYFPYWSSPSLTYATSMLALSKYISVC